MRWETNISELSHKIFVFTLRTASFNLQVSATVAMIASTYTAIVSLPLGKSSREEISETDRALVAVSVSIGVPCMRTECTCEEYGHGLILRIHGFPIPVYNERYSGP